MHISGLNHGWRKKEEGRGVEGGRKKRKRERKRKGRGRERKGMGRKGSERENDRKKRDTITPNFVTFEK